LHKLAWQRLLAREQASDVLSPLRTRSLEVDDALTRIPLCGFIYTYIMPSYPSSLKSAKDLDAASYALVRSWPDGWTEPKAAYHTVAQLYGGRS